ncbi:MAG: hypothetical protein HKN79_11990 [Flavobacteriales bacterium]|nr:hypothetical protein [Flavobacteriales bacterium]
MKHFFIILLILPLLSTAQFFDTDEVEWLPHSVGEKKWRPLVGFDSRRSFFQGRNVKFLGLRFGAEHRKVHRFGLAFFGLRDGDSYDDVSIDREDAPPDAQADFNVSFATLFYERVIMKAGPWEMSTPIYFGGGRMIGEYRSTTGQIKTFLDEDFSVLGGGIMLKYRVLPWLEPGLGGGYRHAFDSEKEVKKTLQQPYYVIKVSVLLGELYRSFIRGEDTQL